MVLVARAVSAQRVGRTAEVIAAGPHRKRAFFGHASWRSHKALPMRSRLTKSKRTKLRTSIGAIVIVVTDEEAAHEFVPASEPEARAAGECKYCDRRRHDRIHSVARTAIPKHEVECCTRPSTRFWTDRT